MITMLAAADSAMPTSLLKLILAVVILLGWGKWAAAVDKDAQFFHLKRTLWNAMNLGAAAVGYAALFLVPFAFIGFPIAVGVIVGTAFGYMNYRNRQVEAKDHWRLDADTLSKMFTPKKKKKKKTDAEETSSLSFSKPGENLSSTPQQDAEHFRAHMTLEKLVNQALMRTARRLTLTGNEKQFVAQITIDAVDYKLGQLSAAEAIPMIDYLKAQCRMDVSDRRRRQIGHCEISAGAGVSHKLRVHTSGSTRGMTCKIIIDPHKQVGVGYKNLGLLERQQEQMQSVFDDASGVVLVAAPSGQGATTTMYAFLQRQDPYTMDIQTLETLIEDDLEAINQSEVELEEMAKRLNSTLLRDPQVVMVSEITTPQMAAALAQAGIEGKRLYAPLPASDTSSALRKWIKLVGDRDKAVNGLAAIVSQRLIRKVCNVCKQQYKPDEALLKKLNLPVDRIQVLVKPTGQVVVKNRPQPCPACHSTGYDGVTGVYEVMVLDDDAKRIARSGSTDQLKTHLRRQKMMWLQEAALAKAVAGITSIKEVMRVLGQAESGASRSSSQQSPTEMAATE